MLLPGEGLCSISDFFYKLNELLPEISLVNTNKKIEYYNVPAAFDIETSSFYQGEIKPENKRAIMYIWQFGVGNIVTTGRTWDEFRWFIKALKKFLNLSDTKRLLVYVHNLPYEFQFIRKHFEWEEVFLLDNRKPVYANAHGIEFRCSVKLSGGRSLENVGEELMKYKIKKAVGNLDYSLIRTPKTKLSEKELLYCENDIRVLLCYIQEKIEQDGDITMIPLTNTGYVRKYCRDKCFTRWKKYHTTMKQLTIEEDEYSQLKRGFQGGFTHANSHYVNRVVEHVGSHDFTSSYPAVMVLEKFPMTKAEMITRGVSEQELLEIFLTRCCLFDIEIFGLTPKLYQEHPISRYKCWSIENYVLDNGRVVMAEHLVTTITEQDYFTYIQFYNWDKIIIKNLRTYQKGYLPTKFVESILGLYEQKTKLKDIPGEELNYMISKNMINATFGMTVTDPIRDELTYIDNKFGKIPKNIQEGVDRYNKNIRRFLYYPWGVWITAYARANLFSGIIELAEDYVYSDTDSVKSINTERHTQYFDRYNSEILSKIEKSSSFHKLDISLYSPKTVKGKVKTIGLWDDEGVFDKFKTIGAKRYLTMIERVESTEPEFKITLAGANKKKTMEYLLTTGNPFQHFTNGLVIPPESAGRLELTYIDEETEGDVVDYNGEPYHYHELSSVYMEPTEYSLSMSEDFIKYLEGIYDFGE